MTRFRDGQEEQSGTIRRDPAGTPAGETILQPAKKHGVHRRMVRQAIASAMPPEKKKPHDRPRLAPARVVRYSFLCMTFSFTTPRRLIPTLTRPQGPPHAGFVCAFFVTGRRAYARRSVCVVCFTKQSQSPLYAGYADLALSLKLQLNSLLAEFRHGLVQAV